VAQQSLILLMLYATAGLARDRGLKGIREKTVRCGRMIGGMGAIAPCGGIAGTIVACLGLLWMFLMSNDSGVAPGAHMPSGRGMVIIAPPPLPLLGFVAGASIGVIHYALGRARRQ
jgi:hypothetical protein